MEVMYPSSTEFAIIVSSILFSVIPAVIFLIALYFVVRKAVRDAFKDVKSQPPRDPQN